MTNSLAGNPLRYVIGKDYDDGQSNTVTEVGYDASRKPVQGIGIKYCNLFDEKNTGNYGSYLYTSDTAEQYQEGQIDPSGDGWLKNLHEQFARAKAQGFEYIELDNCDAYSVATVVGAIDEAAIDGLKVIAKNPGNMKGDALPIVAHPNIYGIIVEKGAGTATEMDALRRRAGKPDLPIWFVSFGDGRTWAASMADSIRAHDFRNIGVTYDRAASEYGGDVEDLMKPLPSVFEPGTVMPAQGAPWLVDARADIGKYHDGPDVPMLAQQVAAVFLDQAAYARKAGPDTSWCGIFIAAKLAKYGIRPPYTAPGDNVGSWMYVDSWADTGWGTPIPIGQEQPGDIAVWRVPHHVNMVAGNGKYIGGNQTDPDTGRSEAVTEATFNKSGLRAIVRPPAAGVIPQPNPRPQQPLPAPTPLNPGLSNFKKCLPLLLAHEGGNDDDPRDPGGRTSRGILQREWDVWQLSHPGLPSDVFQAPQDQVEAIYKLKYWDAMRCDALPSGVDYAVFDYGVNSGISRSAKVLQRLVGTDVDGEIGPNTIAATAKADPTQLITQICDERMAFLQGLGTWSTFGRGWTNRVNDVRASALAMVGAAPIIPPVVAPPPLVTLPPDPTLDQLRAAMDAVNSRIDAVEDRCKSLEEATMTDTAAISPAPAKPKLDPELVAVIAEAVATATRSYANKQAIDWGGLFGKVFSALPAILTHGAILGGGVLGALTGNGILGSILTSPTAGGLWSAAGAGLLSGLVAMFQQRIAPKQS